MSANDSIEHRHNDGRLFVVHIADEGVVVDAFNPAGDECLGTQYVAWADFPKDNSERPNHP